MTYSIYKVRNTVNNKCYIGLTRIGVINRWKRHITNSMSRNQPFYRALRKYGSGSFEVCILASKLDVTTARELESAYIRIFDSEKYGYNRIAGGTLGGNNKKKPSELTRKKMSESHKKRNPHPNSMNALKQYCNQPGYRPSETELERLRQLNETRQVSIIDNFGRKYNSIAMAAAELGLYKTNISAVLHGRLKTTGGYTFHVCRST